MIFVCDDVCNQTIEHFEFWDSLKKTVPELKVIAFVIANYRNEGPVDLIDWHKERESWVTVGVHGYDHLYPPEQERDLKEAEEAVLKSIEILRPMLQSQFLYRPPGHQRTVQTIPMLKRIGVAGIAFQSKILWFNGVEEQPLFNTHCTKDQYYNPIGSLETQKRIYNAI